MSLSDPYEFARGVCGALGIDPDTCRRVTIDIDAGHVPTVEVHRFTGEVAEGAMVELLDRYQLVPTGVDVAAAVALLADSGQTDGDHHKAWVIDQVARLLLGEGYEEWVAAYTEGAEYEWDEGVAP